MDEKEPKLPPEVFIGRLKHSLKANHEQLAAEGSVPGTGVSMWDLVKLSGDLQRFNQDCVKTLATGNDCTGDFNMSGGRKISLNVGYARGADVVIQAESGATRHVNIRPQTSAGTSPGTK